MTARAIFLAGLAGLLLAGRPACGAAQAVDVSLSPDAWTATDSISSVTFLGRPALYINRGIALVRGAEMEDGTLDLDMAASDRSNFMGVVFRAAGPRFSNVIFLRPGASGTDESVQYGPAFNSLGVAWQVYHGEGANAAVDVPRNRWVHVRIELDGAVARLFVDTATTPTLVVPRVVTSGGSAIGVWTGAFGRGAWFSNMRYTKAAPYAAAAAAAPSPPPGTILSWRISQAIEPASFTPTALPDLAHFTWQDAAVEPEGFVLLNRYREAPVGGTPRDSTGAALLDSVMTGRMAGSRIVYARTTVTAARDEVRRMQYTYSNGAVIYLNGRPLAMAMNPSGVRAPLGVMAHAGDALYLPLRRGRNEIVFAVIECTGGWAFSARLDPAAGASR